MTLSPERSSRMACSWAGYRSSPSSRTCPRKRSSNSSGGVPGRGGTRSASTAASGHRVTELFLAVLEEDLDARALDEEHEALAELRVQDEVTLREAGRHGERDERRVRLAFDDGPLGLRLGGLGPRVVFRALAAR